MKKYLIFTLLFISCISSSERFIGIKIEESKFKSYIDLISRCNDEIYNEEIVFKMDDFLNDDLREQEEFFKKIPSFLLKLEQYNEKVQKITLKVLKDMKNFIILNENVELDTDLFIGPEPSLSIFYINKNKDIIKDYIVSLVKIKDDSLINNYKMIVDAFNFYHNSLKQIDDKTNTKEVYLVNPSDLIINYVYNSYRYNMFEKEKEIRNE